MKKLKHLIVAAFIIMLSMNSFSQGVGINNDESDADPSAMLDVKSSDKGFLMPRMLKEQVLIITNPAEGLLVFATDISSFMYYTNGRWNELNGYFGNGWGTISATETSNTLFGYSAYDFETRFGSSVSIDGDYCVVGAPGQIISNDTCKGKAVIFQYENGYWSETATLTASDGAAFNYFGASVSISEDNIVVGAYGNNNGQGKAYVFHKDGTNWTQVAQLIANDGASGNWFGESVAIHQNTIIVGDPHRGVSISNDGKVYLFHFDGSNWVPAGDLVSPSPGYYASFGKSVSVYGNYIAIGEPHYYAGNGTVYIYHYDGSNWVLQTTFGGVSSYYHIGKSISINNDYVVFNSGSSKCYILHRDGSNWTEQTIENNRSANSVSLSGDYFVLGLSESAIYKRSGTTWKYVQKLVQSNPQVGDFFGKSVSISNDKIAIGAPSYDINSVSDVGAVYWYNK